MMNLNFINNLKKFEVLQKKCLRILTFSPFNSHTHHLFIDLKLLKINEIIELNQLKLVYNHYNHQLPSDLMGLFTLSRDIHTTDMVLNSALKNLLHIPKINTVTYGNKSIKYHCAKLWNELFKSGITINSNYKDNIPFNLLIHYRCCNHICK